MKPPVWIHLLLGRVALKVEVPDGEANGETAITVYTEAGNPAPATLQLRPDERDALVEALESGKPQGRA
jgi:hypothetical protein